MKKQSITLFYLLFFVSINVFSQQELSFTGRGESNMTSGYFTKYYPGEDYKLIEGSPYLIEEWSTGIIRLESGANLKLESCMYDIYKERIVFFQDEASLYFSNPEDIDRLTIGSAEFINLKLKSNSDFYEILFEANDFILLKKYMCDLVRGKETNGITPATNDKFKKTSIISVKKGNGEFVTLKMKEKEVLEFMNDKKNEVKKYIADNNLKCKEEKDLVEIFKYYSTLM